MKKSIFVIAFTLLTAIGAMAQHSGDKIGIAFLSGIDGLGDSPFTGISTMDNAYGTRIWYNSWQIELNYKMYLSKNCHLNIGVGYESDGFKLNNNLVDMKRDASGKRAELIVLSEENLNEPGDRLYYYENYIIARYINIPIGLMFKSGDMRFGLSVIPGINYTSRATGLKTIYQDHVIPEWTDHLNGFIRPYKVDVRLEVLYDWIGIFVQASTMPLFRNTDRDDIYPIRAGFAVRF